MIGIPTVRRLAPGLAAAAAVALAAQLGERLQALATPYPWIDGLVLAIILGTALHTLFGLGPRLGPGIAFAAKPLLEVAIVLLGASTSFAAIGSAGGAMIGVVAMVVALALLSSYGIARLLGLPDRLATLVACGNSICGNSAIVAAAPVIEADSRDVASAIAFTAALGIAVVLLLPASLSLFGLSQWQYGVLAGLTVYAVPQVLAATVPIGLLSAQIGTTVKLMRVLMLGPVVVLLGARAGRGGAVRRLHTMVPWFILGFLGLATLRSLDLVPGAAVAGLQQVSTGLTVVSMAALGLSVNLRSVMASGGRVLAAGLLSILVLGALAGGALALLGKLQGG